MTRLSLRQQVEVLLPNWQSWYPNVFAAAEDLGLIRARVCPPGQLLLSARHASVRNEAEHHHRDRWGGLEEELQTDGGGRKSVRRGAGAAGRPRGP